MKTNPLRILAKLAGVEHITSDQAGSVLGVSRRTIHRRLEQGFDLDETRTLAAHWDVDWACFLAELEETVPGKPGIEAFTTEELLTELQRRITGK